MRSATTRVARGGSCRGPPPAPSRHRAAAPGRYVDTWRMVRVVMTMGTDAIPSRIQHHLPLGLSFDLPGLCISHPTSGISILIRQAYVTGRRFNVAYPVSSQPPFSLRLPSATSHRSLLCPDQTPLLPPPLPPALPPHFTATTPILINQSSLPLLPNHTQDMYAVYQVLVKPGMGLNEVIRITGTFPKARYFSVRHTKWTNRLTKTAHKIQRLPGAIHTHTHHSTDRPPSAPKPGHSCNVL
jgi:hypothetical protein